MRVTTAARVTAPQPCFTHHSPFLLSENGKGWRDSKLRRKRHTHATMKRGKDSVTHQQLQNCSAGKFLAFHYVKPQQQAALYERGGSPW